MLKAQMRKDNNILNKFFIISLTILVAVVITVNVVVYFI